jgi:hypothetical protein
VGPASSDDRKASGGALGSARSRRRDELVGVDRRLTLEVSDQVRARLDASVARLLPSCSAGSRRDSRRAELAELGGQT